jgi:hypothetical protein
MRRTPKRWWSQVCPHGFTLEILRDRGGVALSVAAYASALVGSGFDDVTVVVGQMSMRGLGRRLLHDRTAVAIREAVEALPGVSSFLVPVQVER